MTSTVPCTLFTWIMAFLPILVLIVLMIAFRWKAIKAAPVGFFLVLIIAVTFFRANIELVAAEAAKGIWSALIVLIVVWPALLIYEISNEAGAFEAFREGLCALIPNELIRIMAIGLGFVGFLIGITGFGVPVAVGAPLLVGIGVSPLYAVIISLIGEAWGSTFGTLGVAWDAMRLAAALDADPRLLLNTAFWAGAFIWIWNFIIGIMVCWLYGKRAALKKGFPVVLLVSLVQGGGQLAVGQLNQTLACFLPTVAALAALLAIGRMRPYAEPWQLDNSPIMRCGHDEYKGERHNGMTMLEAFMPYAALTAITMLALLVRPVNAFLSQWSLGFPLPATATGYGFINPAVDSYSPFSPLTHASFFLLISSAFAYVYYAGHGWIGRNGLKASLFRSFNKVTPTAIAIIGFLIMSRIMSGAGMTTVLAEGMAAAMGSAYAIIAPSVGLLGAFMTSSNMASNILFSEFQLKTSVALGFDAASVLGAQTAGGAIGTATCPGNITLGCTTAEISGQEGEILRKTLPLCLAAAVLIGLVLFAYLMLS